MQESKLKRKSWTLKNISLNGWIFILFLVLLILWFVTDTIIAVLSLIGVILIVHIETRFRK